MTLVSVLPFSANEITCSECQSLFWLPTNDGEIGIDYKRYFWCPHCGYQSKIWLRVIGGDEDTYDQCD